MNFNVTKDIFYIGVNDHQIDLFEGQYVVEDGMAYNSYIIMDEKITIMDTVDINFTDEWLNNIKNVLLDKAPDYLVVQHMEPDHSASIARFLDAYPNTTIIGNVKTFKMIQQFFGIEIINKIVVNDNETISTGKHNLTFIFAPMVHWPEVMVTYDSFDKVLFSADGFGKFGALDVNQDWACEARRYYFGIVGKYGAQVQTLLKKVAKLDISIICPLHGPVLNDNLEYYINLYDIWSSYKAEDDGIVIAYSSIYGNTKNAVIALANMLEAKNIKVQINDLAHCDIHEAIEDAFRYTKLILATPTYNADVFPHMKEFINHLIERNYSNRVVGFIENGSWAPMAIKVMKQMLEKSKNITYLENNVTILSSVNNDTLNKLELLADELTKNMD